MPCINCPMLGGPSGADLLNLQMERLRDPLDLAHTMDRINDPLGLYSKRPVLSTARLRALEDAKKP